jgi:CubicO group peptidase (beta-lactamase class C family)
VRLTPGVPRLPFVPDPLRRIRVPKDLGAVSRVGTEADPASAGMTRDGVERIWSAACGLYRTGVHPAIQLCVRREGEIVLQRSIGHASGNGPRDSEDVPKTIATPQTPFCIYSASKAVTATVVHMLDERGLLHVGDRVCEYIPEYGSHGKDAITVAHVLSHRAGVPNLPADALSLDNIGDDELLLRILCDARPLSRPGKTLAYHAVSGGFILGEIVRRVTGRDIRTVLADEILRPLGFRWGNYGVAPDDVPLVGLGYSTGAPVVPPISTILERALGQPVDKVVETSNDPRFLTGVVPAANVVTTADELSRFFEILRRGGEVDGVRVMEPRTIRRALTEQSFREIDFTLGAPLRQSLGYILGARWISLYGPDTEHAFGHLGFTNILGWADPERGLSCGLITSGKPVLYPELPQFIGVMRRIGIEAPKKPPGSFGFDPLGESD